MRSFKAALSREKDILLQRIHLRNVHGSHFRRGIKMYIYFISIERGEVVKNPLWTVA